jgi:uncharacterized protein YfaS (alpha-2-macroglobulin family)
LTKKEFRTARSVQAVNKGISLEKTFKNSNQTGKIGKGDVVDIEIKVSGLKNNNNAYLVVEDKLPAGLVPINQNLKNAVSNLENSQNYDYAEPEYTKNGVILYRENIDSDSLTFHYKAKAVSSGSFIVPPATAEMMYNPEIYARTDIQTLQIEASSQKENFIKKAFPEISKNYFQENYKKLLLMIGLVVFSSFCIYLIFRVIKKKSSEK